MTGAGQAERGRRASGISVCLLFSLLVGGSHDALAQVPIGRTANRSTAKPGPIAASVGRAIVTAESLVSVQPSPARSRKRCAKWLVAGAVVGAAAGLGFGYIALSRAGGSDSAGGILTTTTVLGLGAWLFTGDLAGCQ
jgi:hypothetical protein